MLDGVTARARTVRIGNPMDPETQVGPIANLEQFEHVTRMVAEASSQGAALYAGGSAPPEFPDSWFLEPTIFTDVTAQMELAQNEVFGPVLAVMRFSTDEGGGRARERDLVRSGQRDVDGERHARAPRRQGS